MKKRDMTEKELEEYKAYRSARKFSRKQSNKLIKENKPEQIFIRTRK